MDVTVTLVLYHHLHHIKSIHVVRQPWTQNDDAKITELVGKYGTKSWSKVSEDLEVDPGVAVKRTGKQCRERYSFVHKSKTLVF